MKRYKLQNERTSSLLGKFPSSCLFYKNSLVINTHNNEINIFWKILSLHIEKKDKEKSRGCFGLQTGRGVRARGYFNRSEEVKPWDVWDSFFLFLFFLQISNSPGFSTSWQDSSFEEDRTGTYNFDIMVEWSSPFHREGTVGRRRFK